MSYEKQKRLLDVVVSVGLILLFSPFWIVIPILILFEDGFPIIYRHKRVGKKGQEFTLLKFRSMVTNADIILHKLDKKLLDKFKKNDWKIAASEDPRITKVGRFLRALTIDEFPQLFNVLKGDMSMVGPRAYLKRELDEQVERYPSTKNNIPLILSVKPGITGIWQTTGRNTISFKNRTKLDVKYVKNLSITEDITILLKTPRAMVSKW